MGALVMPRYARWMQVAGRPLVLVAALAMSAPGEYAIARAAGWVPQVAWLMPLVVSVYAAVAAVMAATRPKGAAGRGSALVGAGMALLLALCAQVVAHLLAAGYVASSAGLVAVVSAIPPLVVAHMMHLAATPRPVMNADPGVAPTAVDDQDQESGELEEPAVQAPVALIDENGPVADVLPLSFPKSAVPRCGRRTAADIRAAVERLRQAGQPVTGETLGRYFGVTDRQGRRILGTYMAGRSAPG